MRLTLLFAIAGIVLAEDDTENDSENPILESNGPPLLPDGEEFPEWLHKVLVCPEGSLPETNQHCLEDADCSATVRCFKDFNFDVTEVADDEMEPYLGSPEKTKFGLCCSKNTTDRSKMFVESCPGGFLDVTDSSATPCGVQFQLCPYLSSCFYRSGDFGRCCATDDSDISTERSNIQERQRQSCKCDLYSKMCYCPNEILYVRRASRRPSGRDRIYFRQHQPLSDEYYYDDDYYDLPFRRGAGRRTTVATFPFRRMRTRPFADRASSLGTRGRVASFDDVEDRFPGPRQVSFQFDGRRRDFPFDSGSELDLDDINDHDLVDGLPRRSRVGPLPRRRVGSRFCPNFPFCDDSRRGSPVRTAGRRPLEPRRTVGSRFGNNFPFGDGGGFRSSPSGTSGRRTFGDRFGAGMDRSQSINTLDIARGSKGTIDSVGRSRNTIVDTTGNSRSHISNMGHGNVNTISHRGAGGSRSAIYNRGTGNRNIISDSGSGRSSSIIQNTGFGNINTIENTGSGTSNSRIRSTGFGNVNVVENAGIGDSDSTIDHEGIGARNLIRSNIATRGNTGGTRPISRTSSLIRTRGDFRGAEPNVIENPKTLDFTNRNGEPGRHESVKTIDIDRRASAGGRQ